MSNRPAIILVRPQMGENIGASARAMFNFGLSDLRIVAPRGGWPSVEAERNSAGALEKMPETQVFETLQEAVSDLHFTFATTARAREIRKEIYTPEASVQKISDLSANAQKTGFVFGAERTGLTNDEAALCQAFITIPANPEFSSLNLAQAVLLMSYEWSRQSGAHDTPEKPMKPDELPATQDKLEEFFVRFETELENAEFFKSPDLKPTMARNIRTMFMRSGFSEQELRTFHGILSAFVKS